MRIHKKHLFVLFLIIVSVVAWHLLSKQYNVEYTQTCNLPGKYQEDLHLFTDGVHKILQALNLTHFLCYGSLWGQIRLSKLLPWEDKSEICLLNDEVATKDELIIAKMFKKNGYYLSYDATEGQYTVTKLYDNGKMRVILILFEMDRVIHKYRRIGWMRRVLPPDCETMESLNCFPPRLIMAPLPLKEFGNSLHPVPREGIEMQKYHFRNNWWKEVPIKNC